VFISKAPLEYQDAVSFSKNPIWPRVKKPPWECSFTLRVGKLIPWYNSNPSRCKTHALLLFIMHKASKEIAHLPIASELPEIKAKVAVFVGTHADGFQENSLAWNCSQLGIRGDKDHDKKRLPLVRKVQQVWSYRPTLIWWMSFWNISAKPIEQRRLRIHPGQTLAFLQEISELIASLKIAVWSLPSRQHLSDMTKRRAVSPAVTEDFWVELKRSISCWRMELDEVMKNKTIRELWDEKTRKRLLKGISIFINNSERMFHQKREDIEYRDRIQRAYPFHPEAYWCSIWEVGVLSYFSANEGVLRLLAEVVSDLYGKRPFHPLFISSLVNLENQSTRREFVSTFGNEYDSVIAADISGKNAKSPRLIRRWAANMRNTALRRG